MQLHQPVVLEKLAGLEARLVVISFAPLPDLQSWVGHFLSNFLEPAYQEQQLSLPLNPFELTCFASDAPLQAYRAYGLGRNLPEEVYSLKILRQYARWRKQGKPVQEPAEDPLRRGGNFVVAKDGRLSLCHTGRDQAERPAVETILAALSLSGAAATLP